jgi:hypothetical protein
VGHLRNNGFAVTPVNVSDAELIAFKRRNSVTDELASCHTALVDGYVVEGHVPAADILRLLEERPDVVGLTVPGMPAGSPGMQMPDGRKEPYDVLTFDAAGNTTVYSSH